VGVGDGEGGGVGLAGWDGEGVETGVGDGAGVETGRRTEPGPPPRWRWRDRRLSACSCRVNSSTSSRRSSSDSDFVRRARRSFQRSTSLRRRALSRRSSSRPALRASMSRWSRRRSSTSWQDCTKRSTARTTRTPTTRRPTHGERRQPSAGRLRSSITSLLVARVVHDGTADVRGLRHLSPSARSATARLRRASPGDPRRRPPRTAPPARLKDGWPGWTTPTASTLGNVNGMADYRESADAARTAEVHARAERLQLPHPSTTGRQE
jgi:hypothetical protein